MNILTNRGVLSPFGIGNPVPRDRTNSQHDLVDILWNKNGITYLLTSIYICGSAFKKNEELKNVRDHDDYVKPISQMSL